MTFSNPSEAVKFIQDAEFIDYNDSFDLSKYCGMLLRSTEQEVLGRDIVIRIRDAWKRVHENTKPIWNDLTEAAGLYPYVEPEILFGSALLRYEYHLSPFMEKVYLHEEQQALSLELQSGKSVVVSAPTSFGKSLLIEELIASKRYRNLVIIQPTLALLDETRKKLLKYRDDYKIIVSTGQEPDLEKGNIFLFTGERVVEYEHFPKVEFFVIDEFYKLSLDRDDDRAIALNQAFHKLLKITNRFYLLGPMIKSIPLTFKERFELTWFPTQFATVAVDERSMEIVGKMKATEKKEVKRNSLFQLLSSECEQTLIYCASPGKATLLGLGFVSHLKANVQKLKIENVGDNEEIIEWVSQNLSPRWSLNEALKAGIAFHHGALPRHLGSAIVDAFNNGSIRWLFCTSTLIEGVNTSAKNVVLFDKEKGKKQIDFFDYKNIAGRSGRMKKHFIGNVIRFESQPAQMELFVDIPLFNQENAPLEILVSLDKSEVDSKAQNRLVEFNALPDDLKRVLRQNASINIEGQRKIIDAIESNLNYYQPLLNWTYPTYEQLLAVIDLAWSYLIKPGENKGGIVSAKQLAFLTMRYNFHKSTRSLILELFNDTNWKEKHPEDQERINAVTFFVLNLTRHWFDYKLPKWLSVVSALQDYVLKKSKLKSGNYLFFASTLEHGFLPTNLAALTEYDIPISAIVKLRRVLNEEMKPENIIASANRFTDERLIEFGLLRYEIKKLRSAM